jgi:glycosyltransferase involved in cell wall biosynthesis
MKVSIIIPVYNVEEYLEECLESAINQTLEGIEIICVNDGSTDLSLDILNKYSKKSDKIKIINQKNKGLSGARNTGIKVAKGKYFYFLDSDDYIELDAMEVCYKEAERNNLDIVTFDAECFYDKNYTGVKINEEYEREKIIDSKIITGSQFYIESNNNKCYRAPVWLHFYKSKFINDRKLYFEEGVLHEDEIHTSQALLLAKRIKYIPNRLFKRRIRNNSIMTAKPSIKRVDGNLVVTKKLYELYLKHIGSNSKELLSVLEYNINTSIRRTLWLCDNIQNNNRRLEIVKEFSEIYKIIDIDSNILMYKPQIYYIRSK